MPEAASFPKTERGEWLVPDRFCEQWFVIRLPAIAEGNDQLGRAAGVAPWPDEK